MMFFLRLFNPMRTLIAVPVLFMVLVLVSRCARDPVYVPGEKVYHIIQKDDFIYYSTSESGIYRFQPGRSGNPVRLAGTGKIPFRSIGFFGGVFYAASYHSGLHYLSGDTLLPVGDGIAPAWSMVIAEDGEIWLAGMRGIFRGRDSSFYQFKNLGTAHDIALQGEYVYAAHARGVSLYHQVTGDTLGEFDTAVNFWRLRKFGTRVAAAGKNLCIIIENQKRVRAISFGGSGNIAWDIEQDAAGIIYLATQQGLFTAEPGQDSAFCASDAGHCIKSVFIDDEGRLWLGRF